MFIRNSSTSIPCFLIIQVPLALLRKINHKNWLERARPFRQQRETAAASTAPADNCDRTHHWYCRYRRRHANSNRAQLWAALRIELMTHNLSPPPPDPSKLHSCRVVVYTHILTSSVSGNGSGTGAGPIPQFWCGLCDELANRNRAATGCLSKGHSCALIKSKQRSRIIECIECHPATDINQSEVMTTCQLWLLPPSLSRCVAAKCANALSNQMQQLSQEQRQRQQTAPRKRWEQQFVAAAISVEVVLRQVIKLMEFLDGLLTRLCLIDKVINNSDPALYPFISICCCTVPQFQITLVALTMPNWNMAWIPFGNSLRTSMCI